MTIKIRIASIIAAVTLTSSAFAALEWCDASSSRWLPPCEPADGKEALLFLVPRPVGSRAVDSGFGPRPRQVVVLTPRRSSSADKR